MISSLGLLDTFLRAAFLYLLPSRSRWAVWIARHFTLRPGWFTIGLLAGFEAVQYYRRSTLSGALLSAQLNATYGNIELVRQSLYSATTISSMEDDMIGQDTLRPTDDLRKSMRNRCSVTGEKIISKNMRGAKWRHLTHLVHHITDAQWAYIKPNGPLRTSRYVGLVSMKLFEAPNLLPEAPGFWDDARKLPQLNSTDASLGSNINHIYQDYFRSVITHTLLPKVLRRAEYITA
ncbi:hypothetical protein HII31_09224 [Pseudocercospora fuligena]|uniref:Uncharacterized protein n=1 Tax=Pseudocercospora fuligena TaxID=685502 RepID=A0A8H6REG1_9PEZI|nr:hypothetical protein HII31_09224 [Pseudocercospora fuligena]